MQEIKNSVRVSEIVSPHVKLKKKGVELIGLSPFTNEKTASFTVNDSKQFYSCFSSSKTGDVISAVMELEGFRFNEAVEYLMEKAGIQPTQVSPEQKSEIDYKKEMMDCLRAAMIFYQKNLFSEKGELARSLIKSNGYNKQTALDFQLGYAEDSFDSLKNYMLSKNFATSLLVDCGLIISGDNGRTWDKFRDRLMFPICDAWGRCVAFSGRTVISDKEEMKEKKIAKYINSPETLVFKKSKILYNFHNARKQATSLDTPLIIVEGQTDVISMCESGICATVAAMGTALTENHLKTIWSVSESPIICMDGDEAGVRACFKVVDRALPFISPEKTLKFVLMPNGYDPSSYAQEKGELELIDIFRNFLSITDMIWLKNYSDKIIDSPEKRALLKDNLYKDSQKIKSYNLREEIRKELFQKYDERYGGLRVSYKKSTKKKKPSSALMDLISNKNLLTHEKT